MGPDAPGAAVSDDHGEARLPRRPLFVRATHPGSTIPLVALHDERALGAIFDVAANEGTAAAPKVVRLDPTRHVRATATSGELAHAGRPLERVRVRVARDKSRAVMQIDVAGVEVDLRLPPGTYYLVATGRGKDGAAAGPATMGVEIATRREHDAAANERPLTLEGFDLPMGRLTELLGAPAPELQSVKVWADGGPVTLASLRGKVIVLYFWAFASEASMAQMPTLFELHRARSAAGLAIVGVHDDTVRETAVLERRMARDRERLWNDEDPPFPTAIDSGAKDGPYAAYGVLDAPTAVVIDRGGAVVGSFDDVNEPAFRATVEEALAKQP
jgi:peroxiredoxin